MQGSFSFELVHFSLRAKTGASNLDGVWIGRHRARKGCRKCHVLMMGSSVSIMMMMVVMVVVAVV